MKHLLVTGVSFLLTRTFSVVRVGFFLFFGGGGVNVFE